MEKFYQGQSCRKHLDKTKIEISCKDNQGEDLSISPTSSISSSWSINGIVALRSGICCGNRLELEDTELAKAIPKCPLKANYNLMCSNWPQRESTLTWRDWNDCLCWTKILSTASTWDANVPTLSWIVTTRGRRSSSSYSSWSSHEFNLERLQAMLKELSKLCFHPTK